jgi:hypothetical protein
MHLIHLGERVKDLQLLFFFFLFTPPTEVVLGKISIITIFVLLLLFRVFFSPWFFTINFASRRRAAGADSPFLFIARLLFITGVGPLLLTCATRVPFLLAPSKFVPFIVGVLLSFFVFNDSSVVESSPESCALLNLLINLKILIRHFSAYDADL